MEFLRQIQAIHDREFARDFSRFQDGNGVQVKTLDVNAEASGEDQVEKTIGFPGVNQHGPLLELTHRAAF